jgi:hypothetical protein
MLYSRISCGVTSLMHLSGFPVRMTYIGWLHVISLLNGTSSFQCVLIILPYDSSTVHDALQDFISSLQFLRIHQILHESPQAEIKGCQGWGSECPGVRTCTSNITLIIAPIPEPCVLWNIDGEHKEQQIMGIDLCVDRLNVEISTHVSFKVLTATSTKTVVSWGIAL